MDRYFEIIGKPQGKARPRMTRYGNVYTPTQTLKYEQQVINAYFAAGHKDNGSDKTPCEVEIVAFYDIPKSTTKKVRKQIEDGELLPAKKPDCDNIAKIICDALNGIAYHDDAQVVNITVKKRYTQSDARVSVRIRKAGADNER